MEVKLVVVEGRPLGAVIPVRASPFVIGRDPGCQLRPKNPAVSNQHCAILQRGNDVVVQDLGSTNGTLVNDHCLDDGEETPLSDGDRLQVGQLIFVVQIPAEPEPQGGEQFLQEWLTPPESETSGDRNIQTLILSALSRTGQSADSGLGQQTAAPSGVPAQFLYRRFDPVHSVASFGLSQTQMNDEGVPGAPPVLARPGRKPAIPSGGPRPCRCGFAVQQPAALLRTLAHCWKDAGGQLRLCSLSPHVKRMVIDLKLDDLIGCYGDQSLAISEPWE